MVGKYKGGETLKSNRVNYYWQEVKDRALQKA